MSKPQMPAPTKINGRIFYERHGTENYKRALLGLPPLERDPRAPIELVPANIFAAELGFHRRTLGRRILEAQRAAASDEAAGNEAA